LAQPEPPKPMWPQAFSVPFTANVLDVQMYGIASSLSYDWTARAERIDFKGGCPASAGSPGDNQTCVFIFNKDGGYFIQSGKCCQAVNVGPPSPNWISTLSLSDQNPSVNGKNTVNHWKGGTPVHNYWTLDGPKANTNPSTLLVEDIYEQWNFDSAFSVGPQNPSNFVLPPNCASKCPSNTKIYHPHRQ